MILSELTEINPTPDTKNVAAQQLAIWKNIFTFNPRNDRQAYFIYHITFCLTSR